MIQNILNEMYNIFFSLMGCGSGVEEKIARLGSELEQAANDLENMPPEITLNGDETVYVEQGTSYTDAGATAWDIVDGDDDLTNKIVTDNTVDTSTRGKYSVTYSVKNSREISAKVIRTVIVYTTPLNEVIIKAEGKATVNEYGDTVIEIHAGTTDICPFIAELDGQTLKLFESPNWYGWKWALSDSPDDAKDENSNPRFKIDKDGNFSFVNPAVPREDEYIMSVTVMPWEGTQRLANHTIYITVV